MSQLVIAAGFLKVFDAGSEWFEFRFVVGTAGPKSCVCGSCENGEESCRCEEGGEFHFGGGGGGGGRCEAVSPMHKDCSAEFEGKWKIGVEIRY